MKSICVICVSLLVYAMIDNNYISRACVEIKIVILMTTRNGRLQLHELRSRSSKIIRVIRLILLQQAMLTLTTHQECA